MKKWKVEVLEHVNHQFVVDAATEDQAIELGQQMVRNQAVPVDTDSETTLVDAINAEEVSS